MATRYFGGLRTKNPGSLAGDTGAVTRSMWGHELCGSLSSEAASVTGNDEQSAWAKACDSFFERSEQDAHIVAALRVLNRLAPDGYIPASLWDRAVNG